MTVRWLQPVGESSRISPAFAELPPEPAGPATHGRPGGRNPSLVRSSKLAPEGSGRPPVEHTTALPRPAGPRTARREGGTHDGKT